MKRSLEPADERVLAELRTDSSWERADEYACPHCGRMRSILSMSRLGEQEERPEESKVADRYRGQVV